MAQEIAGGRGAADRPTSPHLQVWRWHITMTASILHRGAIIATYVGALILAGLFVSLAAGEEAYLSIDGQLGVPLSDDDRITCRRSAYHATLLRMRKTFFDVMRNKLKMGVR